VLPRQDFFFFAVVPFGSIIGTDTTGIFFLATCAVARASARISSPL
jgi:hypothetical protein